MAAEFIPGTAISRQIFVGVVQVNVLMTVLKESRLFFESYSSCCTQLRACIIYRCTYTHAAHRSTSLFFL